MFWGVLLRPWLWPVMFWRVFSEAVAAASDVSGVFIEAVAAARCVFREFLLRPRQRPGVF